jgi:hypothetical protein
LNFETREPEVAEHIEDCDAHYVSAGDDAQAPLREYHFASATAARPVILCSVFAGAGIIQ